MRLGLCESYVDSSKWHQDYDELVAKESKVMLSRYVSKWWVEVGVDALGDSDSQG